MSTGRWMTCISVATILSAIAAGAQDTSNDFHWNGAVAAGNWLHLRSLNGPIHVTAGDGPELVVDAHKRFRHGDPASVRITVERTGANNGDVLICAIWRDSDSRCDEDGYESHSHHHWGHDDDDDVEVEFTVRLPKGVNVGTSTVNGSVSVEGATGRVTASTVNGSVEAGTLGGPVQASTVNGDLEVRMGTIAEATSLDYSTVNGSVHVYLPEKLNAEVDLSTVNGSFHSDYPMALSGRIDPRHIRATIGTGGTRLRCSTVNGSIDIKKT
jgi:hypothetical protein